MSLSAPTDTLCPVCHTVFQQRRRKQGGGKHAIYCSAKCRSKDWARGHGASRKASILKYETRPENVIRKATRQRAARCARYGWAPADLERQLQRQNFECAGCLAKIDEASCHIDHDHATGRVRGLLCDDCNHTLGLAKDDPRTLRRLCAYLDREIDKPLVYITGALKNPRIPQIGNALRAADFDVMDEWWTPGEFADTNWQAYEKLRGRSYERALRGRSASNTFDFDRSYLDMSDAVVLVMPAGKSAMLELGYAIARNKLTLLFLDGAQPERYDVMPAGVFAVIADEPDLVEQLSTWRRLQHWPSGAGVLFR